jgi:hypothetical protein
MNVKILVCCHKKDIMATKAPYFPIHVGKELHKNISLGITEDNTGDNISIKNASYCELTGLYWAWKNLKGVDVIGLCHYRRYFDFHHQCKKYLPFTQFKTSQFNEIDLDIPQDMLDRVSAGKVIVPRYKSYRVPLYADYCINHISDDFFKLKEVFNTEPQEYKDAFSKIMYNNNKLMHYNMFIMKWDEFDKYCSWLFNILNKVEEVTDISNYTPVQKRIYGYMAERLFNVYLEANKLDVIREPVIWFNDDANAVSKELSAPKYLLRCAMDAMAMKLVKYHSTRF